MSFDDDAETMTINLLNSSIYTMVTSRMHHKLIEQAHLYGADKCFVKYTRW